MRPAVPAWATTTIVNNNHDLAASKDPPASTHAQQLGRCFYLQVRRNKYLECLEFRVNRADLLEGVLEDSLGDNELPKQIPQFSNVIYHTTATYTIESSICRVFVDGAWVSPHTYHSSTGTAIPIASKRFCIYRLYV